MKNDQYDAMSTLNLDSVRTFCFRGTGVLIGLTDSSTTVTDQNAVSYIHSTGKYAGSVTTKAESSTSFRRLALCSGDVSATGSSWNVSV